MLMTYSGAIIAGFGGAAGAAVLLFASDIPRFRKDIMQKIPVIGSYWVREVPPEDNVSVPISHLLNLLRPLDGADGMALHNISTLP